MWRFKRTEAFPEGPRLWGAKWWPGKILKLTSEERKRLLALLKHASGPMHMGPAWHQSSLPNFVGGPQWHFQRPGGNFVLSSSPSLERILVELNYFAHVVLLDSSHFLAFYGMHTPEKGRATRFVLFDISKLKEFSWMEKESQGGAKKVSKRISRVSRRMFRISNESKVSCQFDIVFDGKPGTRNFDFPTSMRTYDEILAHETSGPNTLVVYVLLPKQSRLTVAPQEWFRRFDWDRGYQGIVRLVRDPKTGNIVGEGLRIGVFVLDPTGTRFLGWAVQNPFHGR